MKRNSSECRWFMFIGVLLLSGLLILPGGTKTVEAASPEAPANVHVTGGNKLVITVSYNKVTGAKGYCIYRSESAKGSFKLVKDTTAKKYRDKAPKAGKRYYYKVRAYKVSAGKKVYGKYSAVKSAKTAVKYTYKSKINGNSLGVYANGSVSNVVKTEQMGLWGNEATLYVPNMYYWSEKNIKTKTQSASKSGNTWTQSYEYDGSTSQIKLIMEKYIAVLEKYGFRCDARTSTIPTGYTILDNYKLTYVGDGQVTKNSVAWSYYDDEYADARIMVCQSYLTLDINILVELPIEVTIKDTGDRMNGSVVDGNHFQYSKFNSEKSYFTKGGSDDVYNAYAFGNDEEYVKICLTSGTYKEGKVYNYDDYLLGNNVTCTILSHDIVQHNIYNYINSTYNTQMIKDFYVKVLKKTDKVHALYYYIQCQGKNENFALEGIVVDDANVESEALMKFVSNGTTVNVKPGSRVVASAGTTYRVKAGTTFTLVSPYSSVGYTDYTYSFSCAKSGIVTTASRAKKTSAAKITAKKKGTLLYSTGFAGTYYKMNRYNVKVPGTNWYKTYSHRVLSVDSFSSIIRIKVIK